MAKSTTRKGGPTTDKGKYISSQNATKHGLTSTRLISAEEVATYELMVSQLINEHQPKGITEELLVNDLAMIRVRLARFDTVENALFSIEQQTLSIENYMKQLRIRDDLWHTFKDHLANNTNFTDNLDPNEQAWCEQTQSQIDLTQTMPESVQAAIRAKIKEECELLRTDPENVFENFYRRHIATYTIPISQEEIAEREVEIADQLSKLSVEKLVQYVDSKISATKNILTNQKTLESLRKMQALLHDAALPNQKELDRIYRYKTTLERQFSAKLSQLIQLQDIKERKAQLKALTD